MTFFILAAATILVIWFFINEWNGTVKREAAERVYHQRETLEKIRRLNERVASYTPPTYYSKTTTRSRVVTTPSREEEPRRSNSSDAFDFVDFANSVADYSGSSSSSDCDSSSSYDSGSCDSGYDSGGCDSGGSDGGGCSGD